MKFKVKIQQEMEVEVKASNLSIAEQMARQILTRFPAGTSKLLSIVTVPRTTKTKRAA